MEKEAIQDYVQRMLKCDRLYDRTDYSIHEFIPKNMQEINEQISTHDHTFYFSISTSVRGTRIMSKKKEILKEP